MIEVACINNSGKVAVFASILVTCFYLMPLIGSAREPDDESTRITVHAGIEACEVDLDATKVGKTDAQGVFLIHEIDPTDHYIHVHCPQQAEMTFFVSPRAGQNLELHPGSRSSTAAAPAGTQLETAEAKIQLRQLIQDAVRLRARGHIEEAVQLLRDAAKMDPENSDLHRELGITFLLVKEWKRARVEMLEALRHDPSDSDAHNGLGYALEKLGQLDAALKEYRTATQLDPDDPSYRQHYIDALSKTAGQQLEKKK